MPVDGLSTIKQAVVVGSSTDGMRRLASYLTGYGFQVESTAGGFAMLEVLHETAVDLLFVEAAPQDLSLNELLHRARALAPLAFIVVVAPMRLAPLAIEACRRGANDLLLLPIEALAVHMVLQRVTSYRRLKQENIALRCRLTEGLINASAELERAAKVQANLLPHVAPALPGFQLAARCHSANEVGGDFYDWYEPSPGLLTLSLGDVAGKGMPAALLMAMVRSVMRAVVRQSPPAEAMHYVTAALSDDLEHADQYVTLFLGQLEVATRELTYTDAGHGHSFVRRTDGRVDLLPERGLPLGISFHQRSYQNGRLTLLPGDALVIYSDGLVDADPERDITPVSLARALDGATSAQQMVDRLMAVPALEGAPPDDLTVMVLYCVQYD